MSKKFIATPLQSGGFIIPDIPIFKLGTHKGFEYSEEWAGRAIANHEKFKTESGYIPSVIIGHTGEKPGVEKAEIAQFDNLKLAPDKTTITADYLIETDGAIALFNKFPHRSIEVFNDQAVISRIAQLGGTEPYHKMPPLKVAVGFSATSEPEVIPFNDTVILDTDKSSQSGVQNPDSAPDRFELESDSSIQDLLEVADVKEEGWKLDSALWDALWAIKNDDNLSAEEKKTRINQRLDEWLSLKKENEAAVIDITDSAGQGGGEPAAMSAFSADSAEFQALPPAVQTMLLEAQKIQQQFDLQQAQIRREKRDSELDKINSLCSQFAEIGLAVPVINRFKALCAALTYGPSKDDNPDGIVRFNLNSKPAQVPVLKFTLDLMTRIVDLQKSGTLFAALNAETKPFKTDEIPEILDTEGDTTPQVMNSEADKVIRQYLADNNLDGTHYGAAMTKLSRESKISFD